MNLIAKCTPKMKSIFTSRLVSIVVFLGGLFSIHNFTNTRDAVTGAPGEGTCGQSGCHEGNSSIEGDMRISGIPDEIVADSTYRLEMRLVDLSDRASLSGFQLTVIDKSGDSTGSFINPGFGTSLSRRSNRTYWKHQPARSLDGNGEAIFFTDWKAPSVIDSMAYFYATGLLADGNTARSGDFNLEWVDSATVVPRIFPMRSSIIEEGSNLCHGDSSVQLAVSVSNGYPPYMFRWNNGSTDSVISNLGSGSFRVSITDQSGDEHIIRKTVTHPPELTLSAESRDASCVDESDGYAIINPTGGTPPFSYRWPDLVNARERVDLRNAFYNVTVTDANACFKVIEVFINEPSDPLNQNDVVIEEVPCYDEHNGSIDLRFAIRNAEDYLLNWSNDSSGPYIFGLNADTYSLTITDENECSFFHQFEVTQPDSLIVDAQIGNISMIGLRDGFITTNVSGGHPPYQYDWLELNSDSSAVSQLDTGIYLLEVTDANDCSVIQSFEIGEPDCRSMQRVDTLLSSCHQSCDIRLCADVDSLQNPLSFNWSNTATSECVENVCAGVYDLTIVDGNDCEHFMSFIVQEPSPLQATTRLNHNICATDNNGSILYNIMGGTAPYSGDPHMLDNLENGVYSTTITDANGCQVILLDTIISESDINVSVIEVADPNPVGSETGEIHIAVEGGIAPYIFLWFNEGGFLISDQQNPTDLGDGCYGLTTIDNLGCNYQLGPICIGEPVSNEEIEDVSISSFPNPFSDHIVVQLPSGSDFVGIELYNSQAKIQDVGVEVDNSTSALVLRDVSSLSPGIYFIKIKANNKIFIERILKK